MTASQPQMIPVESLGNYLIFDTPVQSRIPLPELPVCVGRNPDIVFALEASLPGDDQQFTVCHEWKYPDGPVICSSARLGAQYRLSFPGRASFLLRPGEGGNCAVGSIISGCALPGGGEALVRQLLVSQVIPRYLAHRGELLLHASAVTLPNGKTVAFLGGSGQGKSTLASYCQQHGAHLIDDDCILLRIGHGRIGVVGGVPTVRLRPDSLQALGHDTAGFARCADHPNKLQMSSTGRAAPDPAVRELDALFLLDHPGEKPIGTGVGIHPAGGQAATMALLHSAFHLDPSDAAPMARIFSQAAAVLIPPYRVPLFHLYYPRQYSQLPMVLRAVLDCVPG